MPSQVIINDISPYTQITAAAGQVLFSTDWTANSATDVVVYQTPFGDEPDDLIQKLDASDFNVAFIGSQNIVEVTLIVGAGLGDIITITRDTPADRVNLYTNTNFTPSMLNQDFGIHTLVDQQAQLVNQIIGPRYNYSAVITPVVDTILPLLGPNEIWVMNDTHTEIIAVDIATATAGVSQIDTGLGLTGGPITSIGTISFGPMDPNTVWANPTASVALPIMVPISSFALNNPALISIGGLTTVANQMLVTTAPDTYAVIGPDFNSTLITSSTGVPSFNQILPSAVQINITRLGPQAVALNMNTNFIHNLLNPSLPQDAATRAYVDLVAAGLNVLLAVFSATTGNLNATYNPGVSGINASLTNAGALAVLLIDGFNPPLNSRILVKDQTSTLENGIYTVTDVGSGATPWILTRATDYDQPSEITPGDLVVVNNGTANAGTSWIETATVTTVGASPILFSAFTFSATAFLLKVNNLSDVANTVISFNNISPSTTKGDLIANDGTNDVRLAVAGIDGKVLQVSSAAATGLAYSTPTYPSASGSTGKILRSDGTNNIYSTATFADTYAASNLLYANGANTVVGLPTANSSSLVTSLAGVPTWLGPMTNGQMVIGSTGATPVLAALTAGAGITVTNGAGSISIAATAATTAFTTIVLQKFGASGTYTPTAGMKYCTVEILGGGGAGGGTATASGTTGGAGGGGGSGAYTRGTFSAATIGASQSITIGAGGAGSPGGIGIAGGTTSFGALLTAPGGSGGGASGTTSVVSSVVGGEGALPGTPVSATTITAGGNPGSNSFISGATFCVSGNGGGSFIGGAARGIAVFGSVLGGSVPSAGASGCGGSGSAIQGVVGVAASGGAGSGGGVYITEFI